MAELKRYQMYINGEWVDAENGTTFTSVNPATGETWAEVPEASEADVNRAVEAAHRAFSEGPWSTLTPTARGKMLRRLAEILAEHSEPLGRCETVDTGKLFQETRWQADVYQPHVSYPSRRNWSSQSRRACSICFSRVKARRLVGTTPQLV